jgi:hypothetical protein
MSRQQLNFSRFRSTAPLLCSLFLSAGCPTAPPRQAALAGRTSSFPCASFSWALSWRLRAVRREACQVWCMLECSSQRVVSILPFLEMLAGSAITWPEATRERRAWLSRSVSAISVVQCRAGFIARRTRRNISWVMHWRLALSSPVLRLLLACESSTALRTRDEKQATKRRGSPMSSLQILETRVRLSGIRCSLV